MSALIEATCEFIGGPAHRALHVASVPKKVGEVDRATVIQWDGLVELLTTFKVGNKDGRAWLPADIDPGPRKGERVRAISALVLDVERQDKKDKEGNVTERGIEPPAPQLMLEELREEGLRAVVHTTHSHTEASPRYRVVIATDRDLEPTELKPLGMLMAARLGLAGQVDRGAIEPARLFYLPRVESEEALAGAFGEAVDGEPLKVDELLVEAAEKRRLADEARRPPAPKKAAPVVVAGDGDSVISAFNRAHDIGQILEAHGYAPSGDGRWLWPGSESGIPGVRLLADDPLGVPVVFSSHSGDPLADGHRHDAFGVYTALEHGGDKIAAVKAAAALLGMDRKSARERPPEPAEVAAPPEGVQLSDLIAYLPERRYLYVPTRELWPASTVDSLFGKLNGVPASAVLDRTNGAEQMIWAPGLGLVVEDRILIEGGWMERPGARVLNRYLPPQEMRGDPSAAGPWLEHLRRIYPDDGEADHILNVLAFKAQHPERKVNHAIVLGGSQGIGKDTLLEPMKAAVGPWNWSEISPTQMLGRFNGWIRSVVVRLSEARDLGDSDRFAFYDHTKTYIAAPPDVLRVDEKFTRETQALNCLLLLITTNDRTSGIYLPPDDRRHFVVWSPLSKEDFSEGYWRRLWGWYASGGIGHVVAHLRALDLSGFDPKAPPPKTEAWHAVVAAGSSTEEGELADAIERAGSPIALTLRTVIANAEPRSALADELQDHRQARTVVHRMGRVGYIAVRNPGQKDGRWKVEGRNVVVYGRSDVSQRERLYAAAALPRLISKRR
jgi:hypothetical protein